MPIYESDPITIEGVNGDRYWFHDLFSLTGVREIDDRLSGFPVAIFLPQHRVKQQTPLVIGLQGMCAPYGWNSFIVPTLTQMGIAVALFDTPLAGERSLARTFTALAKNEIKPLIDKGIPFNTSLLLSIFQRTATDINWIHQFCCDRYNLSETRLALFGVSMGVLQAAYAFTKDGIGQRLLGTIGHADLQLFAKSWGGLFLPELAASPLGVLAEILLNKLQPELRPLIKILRVVKDLKSSEENAYKCNPMNYIDRVQPGRPVRFLVGENDPLVKVSAARTCAESFPDGACYVVPGLRHGGGSFVDHVRYFLATQLGDWH